MFSTAFVLNYTRLAQCYANGSSGAARDARNAWMCERRGRGHVMDMMTTTAVHSGSSGENEDRRRTNEGQGYRELDVMLQEEEEGINKEMNRRRRKRRNEKEEEEENGGSERDDDGDGDDGEDGDEGGRKKEKKVTVMDAVAGDGETANKEMVLLL